MASGTITTKNPPIFNLPGLSYRTKHFAIYHLSLYSIIEALTDSETVFWERIPNEESFL
jgi:hypothetical protein